MGGGVASKIALGIASTILASTLTLPILATQTSNAYADNTANTDTTLKISDDVQLSVTAPTVINYKLEPDGTFICPTDATIKNNSSIPIATKSWTTNILTGTATNKDDFVGSSTSNVWWNTVSADGGESSSFNLDTETLYDSWNMAASGQSLNETQDDTLSLAFDGGMKNIDGTIDYNAGQQLSTITFTFGTSLNQNNNPNPDPENGATFVVFSKDSLFFYKRDRVPNIGEKIDGIPVEEVYPFDENTNYGWNNVPWAMTLWKKTTHGIYVMDEGIAPNNIEGWFGLLYDCYSSYYDVDVSKLDISNVTNLGGAFYNARGLSSIDLSSWNTSNVTCMDDMFKNTSLESLNISGWDASNVAMRDYLKLPKSLIYLYMDYFKFGEEFSFSGLSNLKQISIRHTNTTKLNEMPEFNNCTNLTYLDLSDFDTSKLSNMSDAFKNCTSLEKIEGASDWDVSNSYYYDDMFYNCPKLKLDCSKWNVKGYGLNFNINSPGVIPPLAWILTGDVEFDMDPDPDTVFAYLVGQEIKCITKNFPRDGMSLGYRWFVDDTLVGTDSSYVPTKFDIDKELRVEVYDTTNVFNGTVSYTGKYLIQKTPNKI